MASTSRSGEHRSIHQDFIARIRFTNALPPPPNPPKLLDIPNTGLAGGQYTSPGFASRLAREQPLNIEADAELGMPLDLVGMPGIFDGDESSIQAPAQAPPPHERDRPLLKPVSQLGKSKAGDAAVSFLRRTEYISSGPAKAHSVLRSAHPTPIKRPIKRRSPEPDRDSPDYVKRKINQTFSITEQNLNDRSRVRHPTKRNVKLVDAYPLLPDLDAFPDSGTYVTIKFSNNPTSSSNSYDARMLSGIFLTINQTPAEEEAYEAALEAYQRDPQNTPKPINPMNYNFYLSDTSANAERFRKRFDTTNPNRDDDSFYTHRRDGVPPHFQLRRVRGYETAWESELHHGTKYDEEVLIGFDDSSSENKAAYYYPVMQRSTIKPQRTKNIAKTMGLGGDEEEIVHQLAVKINEPTAKIKEDMLKWKDDPYELRQSQDGAEGDEGQPNGDAGGNEPNGRARESDEDADADGDEED